MKASMKTFFVKNFAATVGFQEIRIGACCQCLLIKEVMPVDNEGSKKSKSISYQKYDMF